MRSELERAAAEFRRRRTQTGSCSVHYESEPCETCANVAELIHRAERAAARRRDAIEAAIRDLCPPPGVASELAAAIYELRHAGLLSRDADLRLRPIALSVLRRVERGTLLDWIEAEIVRAEARGAIRGAAEERARLTPETQTRIRAR